MGYDVHITRKENRFDEMWQVAQRLKAKVQGDECEVYGSDGSVTG